MSPSNKKTTKRKRVCPEDQLAAERLNRYDKLMHACTKALHKEAKVVKAFECQKIVRRLKEVDEKKDLEAKLVNVKACCLDKVVKLAQQRLGLFNMNPRDEEISQLPVDISVSDNELVERILQHKRIVGAMDEWNEKVTEYRRWCLRRQENVHGEPDFGYDAQAASRNGISKKKKNLKNPIVSESNALFVTLGGSADKEVEDENGNWYGPGGNDDVMATKQNRMGQRARRAKALAKQAKKEGKTWDKSINWRPKKEQAEVVSQPESNSTKPLITSAPRIAEMGKVWKEEGQAHPSWAARASEKTGIAAFAGTKIRFD